MIAASITLLPHKESAAPFEGGNLAPFKTSTYRFCGKAAQTKVKVYG